MFERECELFVDTDDQPTTITPVVLRIIYDDDVYGARIVAERSSPKAGDGAEDWTVCNHLIAIQTQFSSETETTAKWSALDFSIDPPSYRSFEAHFKSEQDARDFKVTNK